MKYNLSKQPSRIDFKLNPEKRNQNNRFLTVIIEKDTNPYIAFIDIHGNTDGRTIDKDIIKKNISQYIYCEISCGCVCTVEVELFK